VRLVHELNSMLPRRVELMVIGDVPARLQADYEKRYSGMITWGGVVKRDQVPVIDRSAHVLFSADLNAACPNSVIEALACGLPVVAFDTGAVKELVPGGAGRVIPYGSNSWNIESPDIPALAQAARDILKDQPRFSHAARAHAESALGLDQMVESYLKVLLED
jgi:glycosyltransferase involved in cell wall biosynthesis